MSKNKFKKKILNHIFKDGKKQISEKILKTTFKLVQKFQKKPHNEIIKLSMLYATPTFRIIKLKKKKSRVEIPKFISSKEYQISWGIKNLITSSIDDTGCSGFEQKLKKTILSSAIFKNETLKKKDELQKNALKKKNFFKHYRW